MSNARRKEPMSQLIRELRLHNRHQENLVSGKAVPTEEEAPKPKRFTYEIVRDDRQGGWFDSGYGVRNEQTGILMNEVPIATERKALAFIDDLEIDE